MAGLHICLVEPIWHGHHPEYAIEFSKAMLRLGYTVTALCPRPAEITAVVADAGLQSRFHGLRWRDGGILQRGLAKVFRRLNWQSLRSMQTRLFVRTIAANVRHAENESHSRFDAIFFSCMYDRQWYGSKRWLERLPWQLAGLSLNSRGFHAERVGAPPQWKHYRPESWLAADNFAGIAVLDELAAEKLPSVNPHAAIVRFPDFARNEPVNLDTGLPQEIRDKAQGRPVIALLGSLHARKGTEVFARLATDPRNRDLFFVMAGAITWRSYSDDVRSMLSQAIGEESDQFLVVDKRLSDGEFNGTVAICDVIYANYIDFVDSSNMLVKAAFFRKPLLVSDGPCIASRTRRFALGEVVNPRSADEAIDAIRKMLEKDYVATELQPRWEALLAEHNIDLLDKCFQELFSKVQGQTQEAVEQAVDIS